MAIQPSPKGDAGESISTPSDCWRLVIASSGEVISLIQAKAQSRTYTKNDIYEIPLNIITKTDQEDEDDSLLSGFAISKDLTQEDFAEVQSFVNDWVKGQKYPANKLLLYNYQVYLTTEAVTAVDAPNESTLYRNMMGK